MRTHLHLVLGAALLSGCFFSGKGGGSSGSTGGQSDTIHVEVQPNTKTIQVGNTDQFVAVITDANGHQLTGLVVTWSVGDPTFASVSQTGQVTGLHPGTTRVEARAGSGIGSASLSVVGGGSTGGSGTSGSSGGTGGPGTTTGGMPRNLTVDVTGPGRVTSSPPGLDCHGSQNTNTCIVSFPQGTQLTLTAEPDPGGAGFLGWGAICSGTGTCAVDLAGDTHVTASFSEPDPCDAGACTWFDGGACPQRCCPADWACGGRGGAICRVVEGNASVPSGSYCLPPPVTQRFCTLDSDCQFGDVCGLVRDGSGCPCSQQCLPPLGTLTANAPCGPGRGDCASGLCLDDGQDRVCAEMCFDNPFDVQGCLSNDGRVCAHLEGAVAATCVPPPADFRVRPVTSTGRVVALSPAAPGQVVLAGPGQLALEIGLTNLSRTAGTFFNQDPRAPDYAAVAAAPGVVCLLEVDGGAVRCVGALGSTDPVAGGTTLLGNGGEAIAIPLGAPDQLYASVSAGVLRIELDGGAASAFVGSPVDLLAAGTSGDVWAATATGQAYVDGVSAPPVPLAGANLTAAGFGSAPVAADAAGRLYLLQPDGGWAQPSTAPVTPAALAASADGRVLVGGPEGLYAAGLDGSGPVRVWRGIVGVGFAPGLADGGSYEVAVDGRGNLLVRP